MDNSTKDKNLQRVQELVYDEDKIVTCNSIARDLNISIQHAKQLLSEFFEIENKSKPNELSATYILSGILNSQEVQCLSIVKEPELKHRRAEFKQVDSELLYSVQKSNDVDYNMIALVDRVDPDQPRLNPLPGAIRSKNCVKRILKVKKLPPPPQQVIKSKPSFFAKIEPKSTEKIDDQKPISTIKELANKRTKAQEPKGKVKGGIANFFNKAPAKSEPTSTLAENTNSKDQEKCEPKPVNGKENGHCSPTSTEEAKPTEVECMDVEVVSDNVLETKQEEKIKKKGSKRRSKKDDDEMPTKRRKRIVERNDSDSDDMFENDASIYEDIIEKTFEEEEPKQPPPRKLSPPPKNKRRKAVDRTYEDEDGFIVTKTEYVYETASEDEAEPEKPVEKPAPKPSLIKKSSSTSENDVSPKAKAGKGKKGKKAAVGSNQPSIMNFFKKK